MGSAEKWLLTSTFTAHIAIGRPRTPNLTWQHHYNPKEMLFTAH